MCGIIGQYLFRRNINSIEKILDASRNIWHRGPDDEGYLFCNTTTGRCIPLGGEDTPKNVFESVFSFSPREVMPNFSSKDRHDLVLAHRRLSIIDLSPAGHQPMCNEDGTVWIVHNGEIYNFREIKKTLESLGHCFVSDSDTEVIIHAYEEWGYDCLTEFNGMWAFCIWDFKGKKLFCSRDRFGIKPFYYLFNNDGFFFASEIGALLILSGAQRKANDQAIYDYLMSGLCDHGKDTFFSGIHQLLPGKFIEYDMESKNMNIISYWSISRTIKKRIKEKDNIIYFRDIFEDSVRNRLISDVPVGTCLSGGLDSSSIVCLISKLLEKNYPEVESVGTFQKTFSSRYADLRHDEGKYIEIVTRATRADARMVYPTPEKLFNDLEALIEAQGEPFGSTSIFAQWCVFELAQKSGVKVTLDGQGADELLAGYLTYFSVYWASLFLSFHFINLAKEIYSYKHYHHTLLRDNLLQACQHLTYSKAMKFLFSPIRLFLRRLVLREEFHGVSRGFIQQMSSSPFYKRYPSDMVNLDALLYQTFFYSSLPALLRYEDRNSMAHSLESRVPFLDHRLVEFVFSLDENYKIRDGMTKWVLREAMKGVLPEEIRLRQDKIGFSTPEDEWFRGVLRKWISDVLSSKSFKSRPFFDHVRVRSLFDRHCSGEINISSFIWRWVNLELWFRKFIDK